MPRTGHLPLLTARNRSYSTSSTESVMQRYGGTLIHSTRDEEGVIEVVDALDIRALHFGTSPRQSALSLRDPDRLELPYIRAMTSALLFSPLPPYRVLILGLGGGSLVRFFLTHFSDCKVIAVERRASVVTVARAYFQLPKDPRLELHIADAFYFVGFHANALDFEFDLILVDTYDHLGMDPQINAESFFESCKTALTPTGVMAINLWGTHRKALRESTELIKRTFGSKAFKIAVPNRGNVIGLALNTDTPIADAQLIRQKAFELERRYFIELMQFLARLKPL